MHRAVAPEKISQHRTNTCFEQPNCLTEEQTDFGQTDFGHPYLTDFGQTDFGQTDFGQTDFGQSFSCLFGFWELIVWVF